MAPPSGLTARERHRDFLRQIRGFAQKTESTSDDVVYKSIVDGTKKHYEVVLREWETFVDAYKLIRPLTKMEDGKAVYNPTNVKTAKDFISYFYTPRDGTLDSTGALTESYVYTVWKWFMAAWGRQRKVSFTKAQRDTMYHYIHAGKEVNELGLSRKKRPKRNFTRDCFIVCMIEHWQHGSYEHVHERYRVSLHWLLISHSITSARKGEYEKHTRYADVGIALTWLNDNDVDECITVLDIKRDHAKGLQGREDEQPVHLLYEPVDQPFIFNPVLFFMAQALADEVLRDYHTWDEICDIPRPKDQKHQILKYNPKKSHWFVSPKSFRSGRMDHEKPSSLLDSGALVQLGHRACFTENLTLHSARRETMLRVDSYGYSADERMRFAAHLNSQTYRKSYLTAVSTVDGQAAFMGCERGIEAIHTLRRGFLWHRNPCRQPKLLAATESALHKSAAATEENSEQENPPDPKERQKGYDRRREQRDRSKRAQDADASAQSGEPYESNFSQTRKLMPERDRLASSLFEKGSLRDPKGRQVMKDLIRLCQENPPPTYCPGLNASASECLTCRAPKQKNQEHSWWSHLYHCKKKATRGFAEFCFLCFAWYDDRETWQEHVSKHLQDLPRKCNMEIFRRNVIRPALCPACLGDEKMAPDDRFRQHLNITTWRGHVLEHVFNKHEHRCPHPRCKLLPELPTMDDYINHQADVHEICLRPDERSRVTRKSRSKTRETPGQNLQFVYVNPGTATRTAPVVGARKKSDVDGVAAKLAMVGFASSEGVHSAHPETTSGGSRSRRLSRNDESNQASITEDEDLPTDSGADAATDSKNSESEHSSDKGEMYVFGTGFKAGNIEGDVQVQKKSVLHKRKGPRVVINVPPVPEDWIRKRRRRESEAQRAISIIPTEEIGTSRKRQNSRRGRPVGSRNKKTLLRANRQVIMRCTRRTKQALEL